LLQDATSLRSLIYYAVLMAAARLQGKPVLLWAQGLGPLRRRRSRALVRALLPQATAISWRDGASAALARSWGVEALVGSDPVWSLARRGPWHGAGGPLVLCWRPVAHLSAAGWATLLQALAQLAPDRPVLWLPFHQEQDRGLLQGLEQQALLPESLRQRSSQVQVADPQGALDLFASAGLVLAMRLHGLILAALAGSPCAALSYDPKVSAAAAAIGVGGGGGHRLPRPGPGPAPAKRPAAAAMAGRPGSAPQPRRDRVPDSPEPLSPAGVAVGAMRGFVLAPLRRFGPPAARPQANWSPPPSGP